MKLTIHNLHVNLMVPMQDTAAATAAADALGVAATRAPAPAGALPKLGEMWPGEGGYFVGTVAARDGQPGYHLIAAPREKERLKFCDENVEVEGAGSHIDGEANTTALRASGSPHPAVNYAVDMQIDEHEDYYLPSRLELLLAYANAPQLFQKSGWYWSSTQYSRYTAWVVGFESGDSYTGCKGYEFRARAFRRVPL